MVTVCRAHARDQLPPLPAVTGALADEASLLPAAAADAHLHARDRRRAGPGDAANGHLAALDLLVGPRLGDQAPHALERDRLAHGVPAAVPLVPIFVRLVVAVERPSITSISVSHFTDATAYQPGTTRRSGWPCWTGSGSPFIAYASSTSGSRPRRA